MAGSGSEDQRWQDLLMVPREEVHREVKSWLDLSDNRDCANVAKAMLALANSGGGQILIGYEEVGGSWEPESTRPYSIDHYDQDTVNGIVEKFADPQFHCDVYHVEHPESGDQFPVIDVPGGHTVPVRAQRGGPDGNHVTHNEYYIRRPGPESAPPKTGREWEELIRRCVSASKDDLLDRMRTVLTGFERGPTAEDTDPVEELGSWTDSVLDEWQDKVEDEYGSIDDSLYRYGYWVFSYSIVGDCESPSLKDFLDLLREVKGHETGWPAWLISEEHVYPHGDLIESWLLENTFNDPAHADFWRASPEGKLFLLRGYQEDSKDDRKPGEVFDFILPIWRVGECLLHAKRLSRELCDGDPTVTVDIRWTGLEGRNLGTIHNRRGIFPPVEHQVHQDAVSVSQTVTAEEIEDALPELVEGLTQPLYQAFDFFDPSRELLQRELDRMQNK